jgi:hypothetical protein
MWEFEPNVAEIGQCTASIRSFLFLIGPDEHYTVQAVLLSCHQDQWSGSCTPFLFFKFRHLKYYIEFTAGKFESGYQ